MKAISKVLLAATLCGLFISCSDDSENAPVAPAGKLIATVGGIAWESEAIASVEHDFEWIHVVSRIDDKEIWVLVNKDDAVGTYKVTGFGDLTGPSPDAIVTYNNSSSEGSSSIYFDKDVVVGSVTITEIDEVNKTVSGSFYSKVKSNTTGTLLEITSGSFTKIPMEM
jgi:hypothetical protein